MIQKLNDALLDHVSCHVLNIFKTSQTLSIIVIKSITGVPQIIVNIYLDYNLFVSAVLFVGLMLVVVPISHLINFLLYRLRLYIYSGCCGNNYQKI